MFTRKIAEDMEKEKGNVAVEDFIDVVMKDFIDAEKEKVEKRTEAGCIVKFIDNSMKNRNVSLEEACGTCGITCEEYENAVKVLRENNLQTV